MARIWETEELPQGFVGKTSDFERISIFEAPDRYLKNFYGTVKNCEKFLKLPKLFAPKRVFPSAETHLLGVESGGLEVGVVKTPDFGHGSNLRF